MKEFDFVNNKYYIYIYVNKEENLQFASTYYVYIKTNKIVYKSCKRREK